MLLSSPFLGYSQTTTEGTEFWFGFMENAQGGGVEVFLEVYISARNTANVEVRTQGNFSATIVVEPGNTELVEIPLNFMPTEEGRTNLGVQVISDEPVSVYQLNKRQFSADAAVILPINAIGKEYYVTAHMEPPGDIIQGSRESQMLIVAVEDETEIEITPSVPTFGGLQQGVATTLTLDRGDTYLIKSEFDLSGTFVRTLSNDADDCKNIAVYGGNVFTNVGGCGQARDHLIEQMFPISTWGENFVFVPYATRGGGDYIKIVASEDGTQVSISGLGTILLDAGDVYRNKALPGVRTITATKPISLAQFSRSTDCDFVPADPFMIMVSPIEQRIQEVTFSAFSVDQIDQYYLTLITETTALGSGITLDGDDVTSQFTILGNYAYASIEIDRGDHTVSAAEGVIAYVYGFGNFESFGYAAGVSLENLNLEIIGDDEFIGEIVEEACVDALIDFDASFETEAGEEPRYDTFVWEFGDGNTAEGQQVTHTYDAPGEYVVTLLASKGNASCGNSETLNRTITITEVETSNFVGPVSVCPDVFGIAYTIEGPIENTYEWEVVGGTIASGQGTAEILVDWGTATDFASVSVTPFNYLGCKDETQTIDVVINKRLQPATPLASSPRPDEVCYLDRNRITYFTPPTNGSEYEWFIEGGVFTADTDPSSNEVNVDWGESSSGRIWYREFNPAISDCEGFSDTLDITIYPEITDTGFVTDALCNGDANGTIALTIVGGKDNAYTVEWDNGMSGLSISGLAAGDYQATITDALTCQITSQVYTVGEPSVLEFVGMANVLDVRCFQESNGEIDVAVQGGTAPYSYQWSGEGINAITQQPRTTGLRTGLYNVTVTDANGCTATFSDIFVDEPLLLEADIETLINESVCPQASDGVAFIDAKGGTPDYQFYWSNDPNTDNQEANNLSKGEYTVEIVDANGCTANYTIEKGERDPNVYIPNAFSPNGDGVNDEFRPVADCDVTYSIQIFNKWGTIVFSTNDIMEGWDGYFQGGPAQDGKYSYVIFWAATINGVAIEQNLRGALNIYR